ncbi:DUF971 domain-containing protein [Marinobacter persicus]|jgi:DUF971 family protein|uniref:Uncharacterized protein DUF971 n=1 Tax=Marinobacter persicus TaxID=930118 RepID=A0A2S6GA29_9GAMM|nr:DUF971 domain-containing protein [Marinobacter persicus]KXS53224.1 MAG: Uncharacterized protein AWU57_2398 [Marinobacter sp. T13-3]PPK53339.1 uncharacterized protein DUF971 [Marinobacter persicus]PPK56176.1 uncharacterized protein DUF971 [Marinobacter persicus]PPK59771.1 uncharacterized protein DUF971 [Marinobacter persicus]
MSVLHFERLLTGKPVHTGNPYLEASVINLGAALVLRWLGESAVQVPAQRLRDHCQCDSCRGRKGDLARHANPTTITHIRPLGLTGLRIRFSDGHDAATYGWTALRALSEQIISTEGT